MTTNNLFTSPVKAINVGLPDFAQSLKSQGAQVIQVDWRPPLQGYQPVADRLLDKVKAANDAVIQCIQHGHPQLIGIDLAKNCIPILQTRTILHAGPPIDWNRMCGPQRGGVIGAIVYEGWAEDIDAAEELAASGEINFAPCHHHHTVGPMAGIVSPSMPVFIVKNEAYGNIAYCTQNEGLGRVLRYGAYGDEVIKRLKWMETVLYPALRKMLNQTGPIDLRAIISQALHMGDEVHNRNRAATSLLIRQIAPDLIGIVTKDTSQSVLRFIDNNDHFFLNLSMAAIKSMLEPVEGTAYSSIVSVMARNGTEFGLRIAGLPDQWFTAPAPIVDGLWLPG
ncbi:MAG: DUF1116 domain-containing protein, partial [Anaerolineae bacterium]|nr:DUF1116 domain-containing protein [Anaerolineae bacterium]